MAKIERFQDLEAWKFGRVITRDVYAATKLDKFSRDFALCNQIRRAAVSVMSNIAEGFDRKGDREFIQFLSIAKASCSEVYSQLYVALDQDYITQGQFEQITGSVEETSRIIAGLIRYLQQSDMKGAKFK